jgi:hypothetical protein
MRWLISAAVILLGVFPAAAGEKAFGFADLDRAIQYQYVIEPAMYDAFRLVAADAAGLQPSLGTAVYAVEWPQVGRCRPGDAAAPGARPRRARNKDGLTPLELARKYGHSQLIPPLECAAPR